MKIKINFPPLEKSIWNGELEKIWLKLGENEVEMKNSSENVRNRVDEVCEFGE